MLRLFSIILILISACSCRQDSNTRILRHSDVVTVSLNGGDPNVSYEIVRENKNKYLVFHGRTHPKYKSAQAYYRLSDRYIDRLILLVDKLVQYTLYSEVLVGYELIVSYRNSPNAKTVLSVVDESDLADIKSIINEIITTVPAGKNLADVIDYCPLYGNGLKLIYVKPVSKQSSFGLPMEMYEMLDRGSQFTILDTYSNTDDLDSAIRIKICPNCQSDADKMMTNRRHNGEIVNNN